MFEQKINKTQTFLLNHVNVNYINYSNLIK